MKRGIIKRSSTLIVAITIIFSLFSQIAYAANEENAERYDPRPLSLMTSVKNQYSLNICWSFAGTGVLESFLKLKGYGDEDLSEEFTRWWAMYNSSGYGYNRGSRDGGPTQIMPGYLTSWQGIKEESDIPLQTSYYSTRPANMDTAEGKYNVTDLVYVNNSRESVKKAIVNYGGVASTYCEYPLYLNNSTSSYYCYDTNNTANHNIVIVGWNDNYSKDNFNEVNRPLNNGAWLIKNSWGNNNSEGGYFWISYEDKFILSETASKLNYAIKGVEKVDKNKRVYQFDEYGATSNLLLTNNSGKAQQMLYANVFDFDSEHQILDEIMFNSTSKGAKYTLYYAPVVDNLPQLEFDKMIPLKQGIIDDAGYMTEDINDFPLPTGKGAIAVYLDNSINNAQVSLGCEANLTYKGGTAAYKAEAKVGESFVYSDNELIDINKSFTDTPRSLTIKAITKKSSDASLAKVEVNGINAQLANNGYSIELPYSSLNSNAVLKLQAQNQNAKITSINSDTINQNSIEKQIEIPKDGVISPIQITCQAADGSISTYTLNISISKQINTASDINKFISIMDKEDISDIISLNKNYDNLSESERAKLTEDTITYILSERERIKSEFQQVNGFEIANIPWQVELKVTDINEENSAYQQIKNKIDNKQIIGVYDISLFDHYTGQNYIVSENDIELTLPFELLDQYQNIKVVHLLQSGELEYFNPTIEQNKLKINPTSFSPYAIIAEKKLKVLNTGDDNNKDMVNGKNKVIEAALQIVKSGDNSNIALYIALGIVCSLTAIFIIKNKNTKK
jgi:C1A family cysteine protease